MEKTDAYVVMTNNAINIVTTDPNVADQAKAQNPGSIVKRFPLTAKMQNGTGIVGEALDGEFDTGEGDGSIGAEDVDFADDSAGDQGDEQPMDDMGAGDMDDENADVICMDTELAVRIFEFIVQNQVEGEELQSIADKMADLGNQSDDVLTMEHFDEITGGDQGSEGDMDDDFSEDDFPGEDDNEFADDGMQAQDGQDVEQDLEIGEDAYDGMPDDSDFQQDGEGEMDGMTDERGFEDSGAESPMTPEDEALWQRFADGEISRDEFLELLSQGPQDDQLQTGTTDPYGDDVSGDFAEFDHEGDNEEFEECMDYRLGEDAPTPGAPAPADPQIDAQYMNGYNIGKRGGQAVAQNINTPQGAAYNSGFTDAKGGKPPVPPSKRQNESSRRARPMKEGVETFAAFLSKIDQSSPGVTKVSDLFKAKKKATADKSKANAEDPHFEISQDPKTTAVKITNDSTTGVHKTSNSY